MTHSAKSILPSLFASACVNLDLWSEGAGQKPSYDEETTEDGPALDRLVATIDVEGFEIERLGLEYQVLPAAAIAVAAEDVAVEARSAGCESATGTRDSPLAVPTARRTGGAVVAGARGPAAICGDGRNA